MKVKTCDIQSEYGLRNTLDKIYKLAKEGDEPFYNLIELILHDQTIMTAMHNIRSNKGSKTAGIDGKVIDHYLQMPYEELVGLIRSAVDQYHPTPVRRKWIPKDTSGKLRPLGIPAMIDRILQEMIRIVIEPIAEAKFYQYSFGYRPFRNASHAMAEIIERIRRNKTYWVIEGDIKGFFDNIKHNKLITMLWKIGIKDKRVLAIIKKMLKSGIIEEDGRHYPSDLGSPQGGILSPLLANIYLNFFDWMIAEKFLEHPAKERANDVARTGSKIVRRRHQDIYLIRYADDWVILCKTEDQAKTVLKEVEKYFKHKLGLELSREKTLITNVLHQRAKFLGFEFFGEKSRTSNETVGKLIPNLQKSKAKIREIGKEIRKINFYYQKDKRNPRKIATQIEKINSMIVGVTDYYSITNCTYFFKSWDNRIYWQLLKTFKRTKGRKNYKKDKQNKNKLEKQLTAKACDLQNRVTRHSRRNDKLFYVEVDNIKIGVTKFSYTESKKALKVHGELSPYTDTGRQIYQRNRGKALPLLRQGSIYTWEELLERTKHVNSTDRLKSNYEFIMSREYAYIRDRGNCRACGEELLLFKFESHHIDQTLPMDKVNRVSNLASLCRRCHDLIHSKEEPSVRYPSKFRNKIMKFRNTIKEEKRRQKEEKESKKTKLVIGTRSRKRSGKSSRKT